jgi:GTP pyrophosphokinase
MQRKQLAIDELYDLLAVRVIVDKISTCYAVLGVVHGEWQYIPKEFDDYIANPKENGYQSLHTVILDPQGNRIEVQIRTREMHDFAELGVAAHWRYKEGGKQSTSAEKNISSLRRLLEDKDTDEVLVESFRTELFYDRVYVLTPAGKLMDLIKGSTPLDFAYAVHTEVGHRCRGAKVNGRIVPLSYTLQSGEQVEILTTKNSEPNRNWIDSNLGYLKSPRSIIKVKAWFKKQDYDFNVSAGRQILEKECQRLGIGSVSLQDLSDHFKRGNPDDLHAAIGHGDINSQQIANFLQIPEIIPKPKKHSTKAKKLNSPVTVEGIDNIETHFAKCCQPIPGEAIIGFISQLKGITIHNSDCQNISQLDPQQQQKLIDVSWGKQSLTKSVSIVISAYNKQGLLNEVIQIVNALKIDILNARFDIKDDLTALIKLDILVKDSSQLSHALAKIGQLANIIDVKRFI